MNGFQNLKNKKVFVTGADGFIGSHLVEKLVSLGCEVKALCCYNSQGYIGWLEDINANLRNSTEIIFGDVRDTSLIQSQLRGADYIFHLASLISVPYSYFASKSYLETNVYGLLNVLEGLKHQSFTRMISTSTSEVYGTAQTKPINEKHPMCGQSPYSASKIAADHFLQAYQKSFDLPLCILRPFNTYGPRQSLRAVIPTVITQLLDETQTHLRLGDLSPRRDFNFIGDTVESFIKLMFCDKAVYGDVYNAGSGISISIGETVELIEKIMGIKKPIVVDDHKMRPKNSEVMELIADYSKLNRISGWTPNIELSEGIDLTVQWFHDPKRRGLYQTRNIQFD